MEPNHSAPKRSGMSLRSRMFMLSLLSFSTILIVVFMGILLFNAAGINGASYKTIRNNKDILEKISILKSDIYQINGEQLLLLNEQNKEGIKLLRDRILEQAEGIDFSYENILRKTTGKQKQENLMQSRQAWKDYRKTLLEEIIPATQKGDIKGARSLTYGIQSRRFNILTTTTTVALESMRGELHRIENEITGSIRNRMIITGAITVFLMTVIAIMSIILTESITRPIQRCVDFAKSVADGNFNNRLETISCGEIGELSTAMNVMAENLHNIASRLNGASLELNGIDQNIEKAAAQLLGATRIQEEATGETAKTVEEINLSVMDISQGVDRLSASASETSSSILEMAASIEEVAINTDSLGEAVDEVSSSVIEMAASIKGISTNIVNLLDASTTTASSVAEMDTTIRQVEKSAMDTAAISETVRSDAANGLKTVQETIAGMQQIRLSAQTTASVVEHLSMRAKDIDTILSVIDEVAEQTNLLALNAAIIAAQAGEHGKGFAVVADEIKELAERTSSSTREIAEVIKGVQEDTGRAVAAINEAEMAISTGEELSERSGRALEQIVDGVQQAVLQITAIARAAADQAKGSHSIRLAMEQVEEMVEQIATSTREHTKGSDMITTAVERMRSMTSQVRSSTREQSRASSLIARSTEDINAMICQIRESCASQATHSNTIDRMMENIRHSSNVSFQAARVMDSAVTGLSRQIHLLEKEMSGIKI